ncbi:MAG: HEAT repeat domain-containing protein [Pirellulaceae bacterium]
MSQPAIRTSRIVHQYRRYLDVSDGVDFFNTINDCYSIDTLVSLLNRGDNETRRASALALSMVGDGNVIEALGRRLCDDDRGVRLMADDALRAILVRNAAPAHHQSLLRIMHFNDGAEFAAALTPAMILTEQAPQYAEAHHQLAVAWLGLSDYENARLAYTACLWRCRYHYLAWAGLAECHRSFGDDHSALNFLNRAVAICPDFESARIEARAIQRSLDRNPPGNEADR